MAPPYVPSDLHLTPTSSSLPLCFLYWNRFFSPAGQLTRIFLLVFVLAGEHGSKAGQMRVKSGSKKGLSTTHPLHPHHRYPLLPSHQISSFRRICRCLFRPPTAIVHCRPLPSTAVVRPPPPAIQHQPASARINLSPPPPPTYLPLNNSSF